MAIQILQDVALNGGIQFIDSKAEFPANPAVGTMVLKGTAIYAYISLGGMETWYPFANRTNSYVHTQGLASTTWLITHNLHTTDVWVQIKDSTGKIVSATVTTIDADNIQINFTSAIIGTAVVVAPDSIDVPEIKASLITVGTNVQINDTGVLINGSYALTSANIDQQIADAIAVETTARQNADISINSSISSEIASRQSADATITANLNNEITTRQNANTALSNAIDTETTSRAAADTILQNNINTEITARQNADASLVTQINTKLNSSEVGVSVASLVNGTVPASQLPSYVDDVLEFANLAAFPATGETSKIYIALDTNKTYRWSGSQYVYITSGAVDSVNGQTGIVTLTKSDVGLSNVDNTADVNKNVLSATKLTTARNIALSGDATGTVSFDGTSNVSISTTLSNSGVTSGTYKSVTVDSKGRVTAGTNPTTLSGYGITDAVSSNAAITAGTATKVTYDAKGLVTAGTTLSASDIPDLSATYQPLNSKLTGISGLSSITTGLVKFTNGVATLDSSAYLTGNQSITVSGDASGSGTTAITLTLANSGVTAGTYKSVTVDAKGRVTSGSNPTTLSGYGITDAQPLDSDLTAIAALTGTSGFLKTNGSGTWSVDTSSYLTGNQSITVSGDASGSGTTAITLTLANSGVTAGTYNNSATAITPITVDAKGRVTGTGSAVTITPAFSSITGKPTTLSGYGITDAVTSGGNTLPLTQGSVSSATLTTSTTTSNQVIDSVSATTYRTVKYLVQATSGTSYHSTEVMVIHDGTTAYLSEYGTVMTGSSLMTMDADISGGNLRLLVTPVNAATTIKVIKTLVNI